MVKRRGDNTLIRAKLRKVGRSYVVTIPNAEVKRLNLVGGQLVGVEVQPLRDAAGLAPDLRKAFEESWERDEVAYRYLAGR